MNFLNKIVVLCISSITVLDVKYNSAQIYYLQIEQMKHSNLTKNKMKDFKVP